MKWFVFFGDKVYRIVLVVNIIVNFVWWCFGLIYWLLFVWVKLKVKNVVSFIGWFEDFLFDEV